MGDLFWLSDEAWAAIEPQLPKNQPGARRIWQRIFAALVEMGWIDATVAIDSTYVKALIVQSQCRMAQNQLPSIRTGHGPGFTRERPHDGGVHHTAGLYT